MFYIADLHLHSHYARATSKDLNLETLYQWARVKGIHVLGTGDFTHPLWFREIREKLEPAGNGLFRLKNPPKDPALPGMKVQDIDVQFCLSTEISSIYKYGDKVRKNHNLVYAPDFDTVARINARLSAIGNLASDGRPILGLPSRNLLEIVLEADERAYLVPAHVWTPWFSTLGSRGGYDGIDECFRDLTHHLFAIETGLSSDPLMNWQWSALDRFTLISNSDAHSPQKLGREATLFNTELSYDGLFNALKTREGFAGTFEFFPEEGKYHHDGHRNCGISWEPHKTQEYKGICPQCGQPLTIGVLHRVQALADRDTPERPMGAADFRYNIPLPEILSEIKRAGPSSKGVMQAFQQTISAFGNEFSLLQDAPVHDIEKLGNPVLAEAIRRMREQEVKPVPGYDGLYGVIKIFNEGELDKIAGQLYLLGGEDVQAAGRRTAGRKGGSPSTYNNNITRPSGEAPAAVALNEAQTRVKETLNGAVLVKAGPGTGKTSTLIRWIAHQIQTAAVQPSEMLAITFTHKAADEIRERLEHSLGEALRPLRIGTFHAVCYRILQDYDPALQTVYDEESRQSIIRFLFPELKESDVKKLCEALGRFFDLDDDSGFDNIHRYADRYQAYVQEQGAIDLSAIPGQVIARWKQSPALLEQYRQGLRAIAVDEFQDINPQQYLFLQMLGEEKNILAIGDPDQAIYGFRGSDLKLFFRFADDFKATEIALTENYRSLPAILEAAGAVIEHNALKSGVKLQPARTGQARIRLYEATDTAQEAKYIIREIEKQVGGFHQLTGGATHHKGGHAFSDIAVVFRTHAVGQELLMHLKRSGIPVHLSDGAAYLNSAPFSLIANILRIYIRPRDMVALHGVLRQTLGWEKPEIRTYLSRLYENDERWENARPLAVSKRAAESFRRWQEFYTQLPGFFAQHGVEGAIKAICQQYLPDNALTDEQLLKKDTILTLAREAQTDVQQFLEDTTLSLCTDSGRRTAYGIHLLTFHAAKGLEFPVVFIAGAEEGIVPAARAGADREEERRLFYVGITRAKEELHITWSAKRTAYGKETLQTVSSFVQEIPPALCETVKADHRRKDEENQLSLF
jgi:DNA helicase-2/ATP-dependent DNA helicase PcrA